MKRHIGKLYIIKERLLMNKFIKIILILGVAAGAVGVSIFDYLSPVFKPHYQIIKNYLSNTLYGGQE